MIFLNDISGALSQFKNWAEGLHQEQRKWVLVGVLILVVSMFAGGLGTYAILALMGNGIVWMMIMESQKAQAFMRRHSYKMDVLVHLVGGGAGALTVFGLAVGIFFGIWFTVCRKVLISPEKPGVEAVVVSKEVREIA